MTVRFMLPGRPVPKGRPRFIVINGRPAPYTPKETRAYETRIKQAARTAMIGRPVIEGPVTMRVMVSLSPPASWSKKKRGRACEGLIRPAVRPDLDNFAKAAIDGCNGIVFKDDGQITDLIVTKRYAAEDSLIVVVEAIVAKSETVAA